MSINDALNMLQTSGLDGWGETEFRVRKLFQAQSQSRLLASIVNRSCQHIVDTIYADRGARLPQWALLDTFDQLRGRPPFDAQLVREARQLLTQIKALYGYGGVADIHQPRKDRKAQLRRCILLANLVDQARQDPEDIYSERSNIFSGPFSLPPGPYDALWRDITAALEYPSSVLTCMAATACLEAHEGLYPGRLRVMAQLFWPMVFQWVLLAPCPLPYPRSPPQPHHARPAALRDQLSVLKFKAKHHGDILKNTQRWYDDCLARAAHRRTGSFLPRALQHTLACPLFTAGKLARDMSCVPRTAEGLVARLLEAGVATSLQRSGQLQVLALTKDPLTE
ncbi:MAG: hypothetical protein AAF221_01305 [Pseudomonadota bacterium]